MERWGDAAFLEKSLAKNFMHGGGDDGTAMLLLSFSFGAPSLVVVGILHNMSCCGS